MPIKRISEWNLKNYVYKEVYLEYKILSIMPGIWCPQKGAGGRSCN